MEKAKSIFEKLHKNICTVIRGKDDVITKILSAFFAEGHILLDDYPGTGKTTMAKALAKSINSNFKRIQFTPDLLPSDIIGISIFNPETREFVFHKGPLFTNILLTDEINRASPRTQSALLEAMAENQASVEGKTFELKTPFFVIATQNPVEQRGTYPLPESQMDRFMIRLNPGYVSPEEETVVLKDQKFIHPIENLGDVISVEEVLFVQKSVKEVSISDELIRYIVDIVSKTRNAEFVTLGGSPRASSALMKISQAFALSEGLNYVLPEHIKKLAVDVIAHRLSLDPQGKFSGITEKSIVSSIIKQTPIPT